MVLYHFFLNTQFNLILKSSTLRPASSDGKRQDCLFHVTLSDLTDEIEHTTISISVTTRAVVKSTFVESKTSPSPKRFESESSPSPKRFESESSPSPKRFESKSKSK